MNNNTRTKNTFYNTGSNLIIMVLKYVLTFVSRTFFIKYLGNTILGINELLVNIIYMLSIAELGLSMAVGYSLYKPLVEKDDLKISKIMSLFKKLYRYIGFIILILGIILYFFLPFIIKEYDQIDNISIYYVLYLISTVTTYFISYKDILINANQKSFKLTKIYLLTQIISFILEVFSIIVLKNFIWYLIFKFSVLVLQRILINIYVGKLYNNIDFNSKEKLDDYTKKEIKNNVKGLVVHKIGDYAVNGTDNIIISYFINVVTVGFYSNYILLTKVFQNVIATFYNGIIPSFGNLIIESDSNKAKSIFLRIDFVGFFLYSLFGILFFCCSTSFVEIWLGNNFILSSSNVFLISLSFFITGIRMASYSVKSAGGIFKNDSWSPFVQAIINLITSIVLCKYIGLNGVIVGTIVSGFVPVITRIHYIYKIIFKSDELEYYKKNLISYLTFFMTCSFLSFYFCKLFEFNPFVNLFVYFFITISIYALLFYVFFHKVKEYDYLKKTILSFLKKKIK